jgi:NAD(P)-dependent dehydrogenase (short-subunit alcohol dehydrogenase family)
MLLRHWNDAEQHRRRCLMAEGNGSKSLAGRIALVTGGSRGIGAAIADRLAVLGAKVAICGRNQAELRKTASAISAHGECEGFPCDITDLAQVEALADAIRKRWGGVDLLVNNAGVGAFRGPLHELPPQDWEKVLNTNLRAVYYMIRTFAPGMIAKRGGDIINISSIAGKNALPNGAAYSASKWGLNGLTYSVAEELRQHNIRVTVVCPGSVNTDLSPHEGKDPSRMLQPEDVAHVVEMLVTQQPRSFVSEVVIRPTQKP